MGYVELRSSSASASGTSFSELIQSDAVTMQFMCVTGEQRKALPDAVKDRIALHQVEGVGIGGDDCHVIKSFSIRLPEGAPNSFNCRNATCRLSFRAEYLNVLLGRKPNDNADFDHHHCRNFVEVKCFSSEFGFQKALFPITVQRATEATSQGGGMMEGGACVCCIMR